MSSTSRSFNIWKLWPIGNARCRIAEGLPRLPRPEAYVRPIEHNPDNDACGGAVNIASRICGLSAPGEILVSDVVRGMARSSAGLEFEDRGGQEMKGVGEAGRVYGVRGGEW